MASLDISIAASTADGCELDDTTVNTGLATVRCEIGYPYACFIFTVPDIASGDTINTATLRAYITSTTRDDFNHTLWGDDTDDAGLISGSGNISGRTPTTATTALSATAVGSGYYDMTCTSSVQEIVNRPGFAAGNDVALILHREGTADVRFDSYDAAISHEAHLLIDYTPAGAARHLLHSSAQSFTIYNIFKPVHHV